MCVYCEHLTTPQRHGIHLSAASHLLMTYVFAHLVQDGFNALHVAAQGGHWEVIKLLHRKFGARVHDGDNNNDTMLHWAAFSGHCGVARYLIEEFGMDPQDRDKVCGEVKNEKVLSSFKTCVCHVCYVTYFPLPLHSGELLHC